MSESLDLKDIKSNAFRLMEEKDFKSALNNWRYIEKNTSDFDPIVFLNIGKCYENLESIADASKVYRAAITHMAENSEDMNKKIFLELLFCFGETELTRRNYTSAIDSFKSFNDFFEK
jgi:lipopolysaccharide biosynthesis regulator YciM